MKRMLVVLASVVALAAAAVPAATAADGVQNATLYVLHAFCTAAGGQLSIADSGTRFYCSVAGTTQIESAWDFLCTEVGGTPEQPGMVCQLP